MKIDLHVHASERSACCITSEEGQIRAAIRNGLDGLAFTDHHRLVLPKRLEQLNKKFAPFIIFGGVAGTIVLDPPGSLTATQSLPSANTEYDAISEKFVWSMTTR